MKEQLTNELIKLLQTANSTTIEVTDILKQKIPELCHQIINWELGFHIFFAVLFLIMMCVGIYTMRQNWETQREYCKLDDVYFPWMYGLILSLIGGVFMIINVVYLLYVIIAPDLMILNYFNILGK